MNIFVHPNALIESKNIGENTRVWAFAHILPGAVIGKDCNICDHTFIENDVVIGDRVTIKCGVQIWDGTIIEDDVFIGPNVTFTNDPFPRSKQYLEEFPRTVIHKNASIGANATILPGITVGRNAMVGAGAVITKDVAPNAIMVGNPARIHGYVDSNRDDLNVKSVSTLHPHEKIPVLGVQVLELSLIKDVRGSLIFSQIGDKIPFQPKRFFLIFDVPSKEIRGEHAHRVQHQFLVCVHGSCSVMVEDKSTRAEIILDHPSIGLHIPPMVWATQYKYSPDAILLVVASDIYDADDYIRDYDEYIRLVTSAIAEKR